ncbi:hypothetical protein BM613_02130 [Sulfoacidibacillus thermotolerans]|uniref:Uncharacterized protein n=2 Tax=Sulfoacidibacillus thermotolerans TaxID=1765684 RepID=A0A2U3DCB4_SULT2|nr:hypothetical protein BM613_02130 [Sulfoacidibacillus thermotolerans]
MERGIKNWMVASIAILLLEIGRIIGSQVHSHGVEVGFDGVAGLLFLIAGIRFIIEKWKRK